MPDFKEAGVANPAGHGSAELSTFEPLGVPQLALAREPEALRQADAALVGGDAPELHPIERELAKPEGEQGPRRSGDDPPPLESGVDEVGHRRLPVLRLDKPA